MNNSEKKLIFEKIYDLKIKKLLKEFILQKGGTLKKKNHVFNC